MFGASWGAAPAMFEAGTRFNHSRLLQQSYCTANVRGTDRQVEFIITLCCKWLMNHCCAVSRYFQTLSNASSTTRLREFQSFREVCRTMEACLLWVKRTLV